MGRAKKKATGKSSVKKHKVINHLQRFHLPRAAEDPNRKHKVAEKVIDHKSEELHIWYLIRFKDMDKPQWLPENNISGCKQLIRDYWIRENAVNNIDTNIVDNYTSQDEHQSSSNSGDSKHDNLQPSINFDVQSSTVSHVKSRGRKDEPYSRGESSSSQSRSESYANIQVRYETDAEASSSASNKIQKRNYSKRSSDKVLQKPPVKVKTNKSLSARYDENRRVSFAEKSKTVSKTSENQNNLESNPNIGTSRASKVMEPTLTKEKNKTKGSDTERSEDLATQLTQLQLSSDAQSIDKYLADIRSELGMPQNNGESSRIPSNAPIGRNINWSGNIIKGSLVLFVASVIITPFPGRCDNITTLKKIANEKVPELCIQHSLPLSYALNLIKGKDSSKCSVFEIKPSEIAKSVYSVSMEKTIMMRSKIVGVIWIEEYKKAWIIFPYHERICSILKLPDKKELKLLAVSISIPSMFDPLPLNSEPEERLILPNAGSFSMEEIIKTKVFLQQTGYSSKLQEICKNRIHFTYFGSKKFPDVQELLLAMKVLGAIYEEYYDENVSLVLVHIFFLKQLLFMRNFMDFKRLPNCEFLIFGTDPRESPDPIHFKEHLPKGGMVSVTTYTFLQEEQVSNRIINVIDHVIFYRQLTSRNASWDYLLYVNVMDNLTDIGQNQNNKRAFEAWHEAMAAIGAKKARYIKKEEIFTHSMVPEGPLPMISGLYRTMLRIHTMYAAERRHFILIRHIEEEELENESVPGVWKMSLQEFELIFGPKKQ